MKIKIAHSADPGHTVEETLPELHELEVCEVLLGRDPSSKSLDSLISGLLIYKSKGAKAQCQSTRRVILQQVRSPLLN
jgi:hypothetical protein